MATTPSLRRLWTLYKRTSVAYSAGGKRALAISHLAFYSGARRLLKVLAYLIERGDYDEPHEIIRRQGRQIDRIQARRPRARRH
jgi:hypothetical protein